MSVLCISVEMYNISVGVVYQTKNYIKFYQTSVLLVTIAIEGRGAEALKAVCHAQLNVENGEEDLLLENLTVIYETIQVIIMYFMRICSYHVQRVV